MSVFGPVWKLTTSKLLRNGEDHIQANLWPNHVYRLLGEACSKAATSGTVLAGFKTTGLWPVDRCLLDRDFAPAGTFKSI
jgi:hypothetical protein